MARGRGQRPQQQIKGFRPGKEPPQLKKQRAKQQFGDVNKAQERLIETFAERSPEESRALIKRWRISLLIATVVLAVVGALLLTWSTIAGGIVLVLAGVVLIFWWRLHRQRDDLAAMADAVSGGVVPGGKRGRKRKK